jgi:hypothetical protein
MVGGNLKRRQNMLPYNKRYSEAKQNENGNNQPLVDELTAQ